MKLKDMPPEVQAKVRAEKAAKKVTDRKLFLAWLKKNGLPEAKPEVVFHPIREWRFDWAWPLFKVALEIDGGVWMKGGGRHNRGSGYVKDLEKLNQAAALGWRVLRITPQAVYTDYFATTLLAALEYGEKINAA